MIALVGAIIAALLLVLAFGRVTALTDQLTSNAGGVSAVLDKTATALEDAGTTAASFATTLDSGSSALLGATDDMRQIVPRLRDLESAANAVTIIGAQPLGRLATLFGEIATNLTDVTSQLDQVSKSLVGNRSSLEANARSLQALGDQVRTLAGQLSGRPARRGDRQHPLADPRPPDRRDDRRRRAGGRGARDRLVAPWLARPDARGRGSPRRRPSPSGGRAGGPPPSRRRPGPAMRRCRRARLLRRDSTASQILAMTGCTVPATVCRTSASQPVELDRGAQPIGEEGDGAIRVHRRSGRTGGRRSAGWLVGAAGRPSRRSGSMPRRPGCSPRVNGARSASATRHDGDEQGGDRRGHERVADGPGDDPVDLVEAIPQHRDADRDRDEGHGTSPRIHAESEIGARWP